MSAPQWHDTLGPREAVTAGLVGLAIVSALSIYASQAGYVFWGYSPPQWKDMGTAIELLGFAVPYLFVKWFLGRRPR